MSVTRTINWKRLETKQHKFDYIDIDGKEFESNFIVHQNVSFVIHQIIYNTSYGLANLFNEPFSKDEIKSMYMDLLGQQMDKNQTNFILFGVRYKVGYRLENWIMQFAYDEDWNKKCITDDVIWNDMYLLYNKDWLKKCLNDDVTWKK